MANAAPFLASPARRLLGGLTDLFVMLLAVVIAVEMVDSAHPLGHIVVILTTYGLYHAVCLALLSSTTPGLRTLDMRIVNRNGSDMSMVQTVVRSFFRPAFLYASGWLTVALSPPPGLLISMMVAPVLLEAGMMFTLPTRQTLSDLVSRTLVVNIPPPQPHRAPAGPMYSTTDAEFGVRPRRVR